MRKITCIYCQDEKLVSEYTNREHVIPQCFGKFRPNNPVLKTVCNDCNQYFGDHIEIHLGRDTYEGIERYRHGIKSGNFPHKYPRLRFRISAGPLKGLLVKPKYSDVPNEIDINPEPMTQVGFLKMEKNEFDYFEPDEIPTASELEEAGYDIQGKKYVVAKDKGEEDRLMKMPL